MIFALKILNMYIPDVKNIFNCTSEVFSILSLQNTRIISFLLYSDYVVFTVAILGEIKAYNLIMKHFQKYFLQ